MKRGFDVVMSLTSMILLLPLFILLGFVVYFSDRGPVFYKQMRVGRNGRMFILYKFRSMRVKQSFEEASFEPGDTSRVTSAGRFMRRTKLDELPQLWNVLRGDMSIVGPRPEIKKWVEMYPEKWEAILRVRPGITDVASLEFIDEENLLADTEDPEHTYREHILPQKLELYEQYVLNRSLTGDLKLIFRTLFAIFRKKKNQG